MVRLKKQPYRIVKCPVLCGVHERHLPAGLAGLVHEWIENATPDAEIERLTKEHGHRIGERSIRNHRLKHLVPEKQLFHVMGERPSIGSETDEKFSDLDVINAMIDHGGKQLMARQAAVTPEMTLRAIELKLKLTQGSLMDDFFAAMGVVMDEAIKTEGPPENPDLVQSEEEQAQAAPDDG